MPFCPKCKCEYRKGISVCADCGVELVDSLDEVIADNEAMFTAGEEIVNKLMAFLKASDLDYGISLKKDENSENVSVYKTETYDNSVSFAILTFMKELDEEMIADENQACESDEANDEDDLDSDNLFDEKDSEADEDSSDSNEDSATKKSSLESGYKSKTIKYNDFKSSAFTLTVVGILGIVALIGIMLVGKFRMSLLTFIIMGLLFIGMAVGGIVTFVNLKKIQKEVVEEKDNFTKLDAFCELNLSKEILDKTFETLEESEEKMYFYRTRLMKEKIIEEYPDLSEDFVDYFVEDKYNKMY